ncbi:MAG TPA: hypothetical protein HPP97_09330 [Desulfuromonadales bacterium]|nr:hypothetical protein [Desulfuromonadales bacterium]
MEKQHLIDKTAETLRPFETNNIIETLQHLTVNQVFANPVILILIIVIFFYGVVRRSKTVLLSLFSLICIAVIIRFAMPTPGDTLSFQSLMPFVGGGLLVGGVVIYFSLIKSD